MAKGSKPPVGKRFEPGKSGNPSGRPKIAIEFKERASKAVDEHVLQAWIDEVLTRGKDWVRCSELLANYGKGKPVQSVEVGGPGGGPLSMTVVFVRAKA